MRVKTTSLAAIDSEYFDPEYFDCTNTRDGTVTMGDAAYHLATYLFDELGFYEPSVEQHETFKTIMLKINGLSTDLAAKALNNYKDERHDT